MAALKVFDILLKLPCVRENIRKASGQCIFYRKITRPADSISEAVSKVQEGRKRPMSSDDRKFKRLPRNEGASTKAETVSPGKRKRVEKVVAMEMDSQQAVKLGRKDSVSVSTVDDAGLTVQPCGNQ